MVKVQADPCRTSRAAGATACLFIGKLFTVEVDVTVEVAVIVEVQGVTVTDI